MMFTDEERVALKEILATLSTMQTTMQTTCEEIKVSTGRMINTLSQKSAEKTSDEDNQIGMTRSEIGVELQIHKSASEEDSMDLLVVSTKEKKSCFVDFDEGSTSVESSKFTETVIELENNDTISGRGIDSTKVKGIVKTPGELPLNDFTNFPLYYSVEILIPVNFHSSSSMILSPSIICVDEVQKNAPTVSWGSRLVKFIYFDPGIGRILLGTMTASLDLFVPAVIRNTDLVHPSPGVKYSCYSEGLVQLKTLLYIPASEHLWIWANEFQCYASEIFKSDNLAHILIVGKSIRTCFYVKDSTVRGHVLVVAYYESCQYTEFRNDFNAFIKQLDIQVVLCGVISSLLAKSSTSIIGADEASLIFNVYWTLMEAYLQLGTSGTDLSVRKASYMCFMKDFREVADSAQGADVQRKLSRIIDVSSASTLSIQKFHVLRCFYQQPLVMQLFLLLRYITEMDIYLLRFVQALNQGYGLVAQSGLSLGVGVDPKKYTHYFVQFLVMEVSSGHAYTGIMLMDEGLLTKEWCLINYHGKEHQFSSMIVLQIQRMVAFWNGLAPGVQSGGSYVDFSSKGYIQLEKLTVCVTDSLLIVAYIGSWLYGHRPPEVWPNSKVRSSSTVNDLNDIDCIFHPNKIQSAVTEEVHVRYSLILVAFISSFQINMAVLPYYSHQPYRVIISETTVGQVWRKSNVFDPGINSIICSLFWSVLGAFCEVFQGISNLVVLLMEDRLQQLDINTQEKYRAWIFLTHQWLLPRYVLYGTVRNWSVILCLLLYDYKVAAISPWRTSGRQFNPITVLVIHFEDDVFISTARCLIAWISMSKLQNIHPLPHCQICVSVHDHSHNMEISKQHKLIFHLSVVDGTQFCMYHVLLLQFLSDLVHDVISDPFCVSAYSSLVLEAIIAASGSVYNVLSCYSATKSLWILKSVIFRLESPVLCVEADKYYGLNVLQSRSCLESLVLSVESDVNIHKFVVSAIWIFLHEINGRLWYFSWFWRGYTPIPTRILVWCQLTLSSPPCIQEYHILHDLVNFYSCLAIMNIMVSLLLWRHTPGNLGHDIWKIAWDSRRGSSPLGSYLNNYTQSFLLVTITISINSYDSEGYRRVLGLKREDISSLNTLNKNHLEIELTQCLVQYCTGFLSYYRVIMHLQCTSLKLIPFGWTKIRDCWLYIVSCQRADLFDILDVMSQSGALSGSMASGRYYEKLLILEDALNKVLKSWEKSDESPDPVMYISLYAFDHLFSADVWAAGMANFWDIPYVFTATQFFLQTVGSFMQIQWQIAWDFTMRIPTSDLSVTLVWHIAWDSSLSLGQMVDFSWGIS